jgi:hypothetical protein
MLEYVLIIPVIMALTAAAGKVRLLKARPVFLCLCFGLLYAASVLRYGVGYDYFMYTQGFFKMGMDGFSTLSYMDWDRGFVILTKIIVYFTRDPRIYMAVLSLVCLAGPFYVIYRYSKKPWLSVVLYVNLYFYYCSINFLRQSVAISITLFACSFLLNRKFLPYLGIVLFAAAFHYTALIMIPVYVLCNFSPSRKIPILYGFLALWVYITSMPILDLLLGYMYGNYKESVFILEGVGLVHFVIPAVITAACVAFVPKFAKLDKGDKTCTRYANLVYFGCFWMAVMLRHSLFERLSYYGYIYVILLVPELLALMDKYAEGKPATAEPARPAAASGFLVPLLIAAVTTAYNIYGLTLGDRGVHGVYPYQSWLFGDIASAVRALFAGG